MRTAAVREPGKALSTEAPYGRMTVGAIVVEWEICVRWEKHFDTPIQK